MRILLITQGVSRVVEPLVNSGHDVVGILESMPRGYDGSVKNPKIIFLLKKLYSLVKGQDIFLSDYCKRKKIEYGYIWKGNAKDSSLWIESLRPDLIVVFSMSQLLKEDILNIPRFGVINLHPSYLPSYRGANPDFWQYYDMEMNPGATVHYVDAGEDTGDIIFQDRVHIPLGTKSPIRLDKLIGEIGVSLMLKAVDAIAQGNAPRTPQPMQSPTNRSRNLLLNEHAQIIDWQGWSIERVWHVLRGTESWLNAVPPPEGLFAGQRWSVLGCEKTDTAQGEIGTIGKHKNKKCIFARDGVVYIEINFNIKNFILKFFK
ncbi:methionyl-tRNA formyltransferase [Pseudomonas sp.]|uniref:methionyl-tRNA formyltransferase n=1 Tax=Pseudomonas sp. TaxID=306 RepID=UPI002734ADA4|nr:formyltransferase family protein [Pseudomonas sp.]MDP2747780.1 formyltransferase family protein [Pseudomonas sp.]